MGKLEFSKGSDTIRQMPENYVMAVRLGRRWVCDPDGAADRTLVMKLTVALFLHNNKFGSGELLVSQVNTMSDVSSAQVKERAIEIYYGRACNCDMCTDEVSRTLDELLDNERVPQYPVCQKKFELVTIIVMLDRKNLSDF